MTLHITLEDLKSFCLDGNQRSAFDSLVRSFSASEDTSINLENVSDLAKKALETLDQAVADGEDGSKRDLGMFKYLLKNYGS